MAEQRSPSEQLAELVARQARLAARVGAVEAEHGAAAEAARQAADELVALERRAASGEKVTEVARRKAEDALLQAKTAAAAPWDERTRAARLATQDAEHAVQRFAREHIDELLDELAAEGEAAAQAQNVAAQAVVTAYRERANIEQRTFALLTLALGQTRPNDVQRSRADALRAAAERLLAEGGETPPAVVARPGEARRATVASAV